MAKFMRLNHVFDWENILNNENDTIHGKKMQPAVHGHGRGEKRLSEDALLHSRVVRLWPGMTLKWFENLT